MGWWGGGEDHFRLWWQCGRRGRSAKEAAGRRPGTRMGRVQRGGGGRGGRGGPRAAPLLLSTFPWSHREDRSIPGRGGRGRGRTPLTPRTRWPGGRRGRRGRERREGEVGRGDHQRGRLGGPDDSLAVSTAAAATSLVVGEAADVGGLRGLRGGRGRVGEARGRGRRWGGRPLSIQDERAACGRWGGGGGRRGLRRRRKRREGSRGRCAATAAPTPVRWRTTRAAPRWYAHDRVRWDGGGGGHLFRHPKGRREDRGEGVVVREKRGVRVEERLRRMGVHSSPTSSSTTPHTAGDGHHPLSSSSSSCRPRAVPPTPTRRVIQ